MSMNRNISARLSIYLSIIFVRHNINFVFIAFFRLCSQNSNKLSTHKLSSCWHDRSHFLPSTIHFSQPFCTPKWRFWHGAMQISDGCDSGLYWRCCVGRYTGYHSNWALLCSDTSPWYQVKAYYSETEGVCGECHTLSNFFFGKPWGLFVTRHDWTLNTSSMRKTRPYAASL